MKKYNDLKNLYAKIELDSTEHRELLSRLKEGKASENETDQLLDIISSKGGKILEEIMDFENQLIEEINGKLEDLENLEKEDNDIAHLEDPAEKKLKASNVKKKYKKYVADLEELIETARIAYFQIKDYHKFEDQLYDLKESLSHYD